MRHQPPTTRLARLRQQNPSPIPRNRQHSTGRYRREQAARHHAQSSRQNPRLQTKRPGHLRLGDPRQTATGAHLRQIQRTVCELNQPHTPQQNRPIIAALRLLVVQHAHGLVLVRLVLSSRRKRRDQSRLR